MDEAIPPTPSERVSSLLSQLNLHNAFEVSVEPGWESIVTDTIHKIAEVRDSKNLDTLKVTQIKEKFGGLRIYMNESDKDVEKYIYEAEDKCYHTCADCGKEGRTVNQNGWMITLCDECSKK